MTFVKTIYEYRFIKFRAPDGGMTTASIAPAVYADLARAFDYSEMRAICEEAAKRYGGFLDVVAFPTRSAFIVDALQTAAAKKQKGGA